MTTTPEPAVSPAPDTEALRQQVAESIARDKERITSWDELSEWGQEMYSQKAHELLASSYVAGLRADLDQARAERDALSRMLRGMARRVGEVRDEMRFATVHIGQWQKVAQRLRSQRDSARQLAGARTIPDDAAVDRLAARLIRLKVYGVDLPGHDERVRRQWTTVYTADEREVWRREARALLADLGLSTPITVGASATGSNVDAGSVGASTPTTDPAPAAADQPMPADEKPILAHTTGWQGVVERAALRCCDVDGRNWNLVSEADRDRYRQYGMAMFRALPPHIAGQMSAAPQAPAEPTEKPTLDQIHRFITEDTAPDLSAPAAREDAATPEAAPHDVEVTVQDDGWATAECRTCAAHIGESTEDTVSDWADQHRADTLRPSGPLAPIRHEEE